MCNAKTINNQKCSLQPYKPLCHIHLKIQNKQQNEILINKFIEKLKLNNTDYKNLFNSHEKQSNEIKNLNKTIQLKTFKNRDNKMKLLSKINKLENENNEMREYYNNYKIILEYENTRQNLIINNIDIYTYNDNEFHELRKKRNLLAHKIYN